MKKKTIIALIVVVLISIVVTLIWINYFKDDYPNMIITSEEISKTINNNMGIYSNPLRVLTDKEILEKYNIETDKIENSYFQIATTSIRADELVVIKVKNIYDIQYIKDKIYSRIANKEKEYIDFLQEQYELVKEPLVIIKGKYILFSISNINDKIEKEFNSNFE